MKRTIKIMKGLILSVLLLAAIAACSSPGNKERENISIVERYIEAVENLNYQEMSSLLSEDYMGFGPNYGDSVTREAAVENWKYVAEDVYDSINYRKSNNIAMTVVSGNARGDWVSNWSELYIRFQSGMEVMLWTNSVYKIEDGKIARSLTFYNEMDALRQLGYRITSGQ